MPDGQKFLTAGQDGLVKVSPHCAQNWLLRRSWDIGRFSGTLLDAVGRRCCGTRGGAAHVATVHGA